MGNFITLSLHELKKNLTSASFYFVAALFLFYQGIVFALFVSLRQHPLSPPGPMFAPYFGGPFWFWPLLILVVTELSHDAISREKSLGTLNLLLASPLSPSQIIWAKFTGALLSYVLLWIMTVPLIVFIMMYVSADETVLLAPVITGYAGNVLTGAAGIAAGLFFSSLTEDTRLSGMLTFVFLFLLVLLKILVNPAFGIISSPSVVKFISYVNFFDYMESFAAGKITWLHVTVLIGVTILFVTAAGKVLGFTQTKRGIVTIIDFLLIFFLIFEVSYLLKNKVSDYTGTQKTVPAFEKILKNIRSETNIYIFAAPPSNSLYFHPIPALEHRLEYLKSITSYLKWERVNVLKPGKKEMEEASRFGLDLEKIRQDNSALMEGVVVIARDNMFKKFMLADIFTADIKNKKVHFNGMKLDAAIASSIDFFMHGGKNLICVSMGHGEAFSHNLSDPSSMDKMLNLYKKHGFEVRFLQDLTKPVQNDCSVLLFAAPSSSFMDSEIENIKEYAYSGGNFIFIFNETGGEPSVLISFLRENGILVSDYLISDPENAVNSEQGYMWLGKFKKENWNVLLYLPRALVAPGGKSLIAPSDKFVYLRKESDKRFRIIKHTAKLKPSVVTLVSTSYGGKIAVFGFARSFRNVYLDSDGTAKDSSGALLLYVTNKMTGGTVEDIPNTPVIHHYLLLKPSEVRAIHVLGMLIMPAFILALGLWINLRKKLRTFVQSGNGNLNRK